MLPVVLWDASTLLKRYVEEVGSDVVDALFDAVPLAAMVATFWGYAESYAILVRKRNAGRLNASEFTAAMSELYQEVIRAGDFVLLSLDDETVMNSIAVIAQHNLNSADAAILTAYLEYERGLPDGSPPCLLVAADQRLLRAAQAEGFQTLNPESLAAADVPGILAAL
jgi:predicted nucleic acid-binding protein